MTITITLGQLFFILVGIAELAFMVYLFKELLKGGNAASSALFCLLIMVGWVLATFFLYAGIYLW